MRVSDLLEGVLVVVKRPDARVEGYIEKIEGKFYTINTEKGIFVVEVGKFNLGWTLQKERAFPGVGSLKYGDMVRLGRPLGKTFIPGQQFGFIDGFKKEEDNYYIIVRNLNQHFCKELQIKDYRKKWILEK